MLVMFIWICVVVTLSSRSIRFIGLEKIASSREKKMFVRVKKPVCGYYTSYIMRIAYSSLSGKCSVSGGEC